MEVTGRGRFYGQIQPGGIIRIDDERNPSFWLCIRLTRDELHELASGMDDADEAEADDMTLELRGEEELRERGRVAPASFPLPISG